jgi:hypothetical protein
VCSFPLASPHFRLPLQLLSSLPQLHFTPPPSSLFTLRPTAPNPHSSVLIQGTKEKRSVGEGVCAPQTRSRMDEKRIASTHEATHRCERVTHINCHNHKSPSCTMPRLRRVTQVRVESGRGRTLESRKGRGGPQKVSSSFDHCAPVQGKTRQGRLCPGVGVQAAAAAASYRSCASSRRSVLSFGRVILTWPAPGSRVDEGRIRVGRRPSSFALSLTHTILPPMTEWLTGEGEGLFHFDSRHLHCRP